MKQKKVGITGHDASVLCKELANDDTFAALLAFVERDMRSLWLADDCLTVVKTAREAAPWLNKVAHAVQPTTMLSAALRPGGDEDNKAGHRNLAFARAYRNGLPLDTYPMQLMKALEAIMANEVEKAFQHPLVAEMRRETEERYAYLERALKNGHADDVVRRILTEKATKMAQTREELSRAVAEHERGLLGYEPASPDVQRMLKGIEGVAEGVETLRRRAKCPPASARAQSWVLDRVKYLRENPQAIAGNVSRRRVFLRDAWNTDCEMAAIEYNLPDYDAYRRCYEAARKAAARRA